MAKKLWEGRFSEQTAEIVEAFTASIDLDKRLYVYDIEGSIAHCKMLAKTGIISEDEAGVLVKGLEQIKGEIDDGKFQFDTALEDIHMHVESRLVEIVGKVANKLHTARSRNDQIALDARMFLKDTVKRMIQRLVKLQLVIVNLAEKHFDVLMPGYTHLQRAQPILFAHHCMAYFEMFARDVQRLEDCLKRIDVMPLGSAALAGTTFPIDRNFTAPPAVFVGETLLPDDVQSHSAVPNTQISITAPIGELFDDSPLVSSDQETTVKYFVPIDDTLDDLWQQIEFDDGDWPSGPTGLGDGDDVSDSGLKILDVQHQITTLWAVPCIKHERLARPSTRHGSGCNARPSAGILGRVRRGPTPLSNYAGGSLLGRY